jgi:hypothetical protein
MHTRIGRILFTMAALAVTLAPGAEAQVRGSERGTVSQTVDGTTVTLTYARPAARGRVLFGDLVPYGEPWTGANWATTFEADRNVRLNGVEVPAGRYSLWMVPAADEWRVFLDPRVELYHFQKPDSMEGQIHLAARAGAGPHVETLTWSFPVVTGAGTVLRLHWGETTLPLEVLVEPTRPAGLVAEARAPYLGRYELSIPPGIGWPTSAQLEVFEQDGMLRARLPFPVHPGDALTFDLVPAGIDRFNGGHYQDGRLFNIEMGVIWEFDLEDGVAVRARIRGVEGSVFGEGSRVTG